MTIRPSDLYSIWRDALGVELRWRVDNVSDVITSWDGVQVYSRDSDADPWAELGSPVALADDQAEYSYTHASGVETTEYAIAYYEAAGPTYGDKTDYVVGSGGGRYITVAELRSIGWTLTQASNDDLRRAIFSAESFIEKTTRQQFYPRQMVIRVDGTGSHILPLDTPIVEANSIRVLSSWAEFGTVYGNVILDNVRVGNRHLTEGLINPDDRDAPCLTFEAFEHALPNQGRRVSTWWEGTHNIEIHGWFGYTELNYDDPVGETSEGSQIPLSRGHTPLLISRAASLLVAKYLPSPANSEDYYDSVKEYFVEKYKTRDQEIVYNAEALKASGAGGGITGDPEVDRFLGLFLGPIEMAFV